MHENPILRDIRNNFGHTVNLKNNVIIELLETFSWIYTLIDTVYVDIDQFVIESS